MKRILLNVFNFTVVLVLMFGPYGTNGISHAVEQEVIPTIEMVVESEKELTYRPSPRKYITSFLQKIEYIELDTEEHCLLQITKNKNYITALQRAKYALEVGERKAVQGIINLEIDKVNEVNKLYNQRIIVLREQERWNEKYKEYPVATQLWTYLVNDMGLNNYVAAGIVGNIMVETGGQTLDIEWNIYSSGKGYYGLCQWYIPYNPSIKGASFEEQLNYLNSSIGTEFNTFGSVCYQWDFDYTDFVQLDDARTAALAFAKCYERCAATSYNYLSRQSCAEVAYNYFVD